MIIQADARYLPLADGAVQCVMTSPPSNAHSIEQFCALIAGFHLTSDFDGSNAGPDMTTALGDASDLALFFNPSEYKTVLSLWALDSQVRQQSPKCGHRFHVGLAPAIQRFPSLCASVFVADIPAERFREKVDCVSLNLPYVNAFAVVRLSRVADDALTVGTALDADSAIGIEHSSKVRKVYFLHIAYPIRRRRWDERRLG